MRLEDLQKCKALNVASERYWPACCRVEGVTRPGRFLRFSVRRFVVFYPILPSCKMVFRKTKPTTVFMIRRCIRAGVNYTKTTLIFPKPQR